MPCAGMLGNINPNCVASESFVLRKYLSSAMSPAQKTLFRRDRGVQNKDTHRQHKERFEDKKSEYRAKTS